MAHPRSKLPKKVKATAKAATGLRDAIAAGGQDVVSRAVQRSADDVARLEQTLKKTAREARVKGAEASKAAEASKRADPLHGVDAFKQVDAALRGGDQLDGVDLVSAGLFNEADASERTDRVSHEAMDLAFGDLAAVAEPASAAGAREALDGLAMAETVAFAPAPTIPITAAPITAASAPAGPENLPSRSGHVMVDGRHAASEHGQIPGRVEMALGPILPSSEPDRFSVTFRQPIAAGSASLLDPSSLTDSLEASFEAMQRMALAAFRANARITLDLCDALAWPTGLADVVRMQASLTRGSLEAMREQAHAFRALAHVLAFGSEAG